MTASRLPGGVLVSPVWDDGPNAEAAQLVANMGDTTQKCLAPLSRTPASVG